MDATQYMKNSGSKKESYGRYIADHIDKVVTKDEANRLDLTSQSGKRIFINSMNVGKIRLDKKSDER